METETETSEIYEYNGIEVTEPVDISTLWSEEIAPVLETSDDPQRCADIAEEFLRAVAAVEHEQGYLNSKEAWKKRVSEITDSNKSEINDTYDRVSQELAADIDGDDDDDTEYERVPVDKYLKGNVDELYVIKSTDSNVDTKYQWHFETGDVVETKKEWKQEHLMKEILFDEVGIFATDAVVDDYEKWAKSWVMMNRQVETVRGARTAAAEDLQSEVSTYVAYTDREIAAREGQCYVEDTDYQMVEVSNQVVKRICEEHALGNESALHAELKAMGVLARNSRKTTLENGSQLTWWCLNAGWVTPREVSDPEANDDADDEDELLVGGGAE